VPTIQVPAPPATHRYVLASREVLASSARPCAPPTDCPVDETTATLSTTTSYRSRLEIDSLRRHKPHGRLSTKRVKPTNAFAPLSRKGNWDIRYASAVPSLTRIAAALAAWSTPLLLTSCHSAPSGDHAHTLPTDDKPVITGEPAAYNSADVAFANSMTAQEQEGIDISHLVPDRSTNSELVTFAAKTAVALQVDTEVLKALGAQWKEGQDKQPGDGGPTSTTGGIVDNPAIAKLDSLHGREFDTLWLKSMIGLDQGAIGVANAEVANGKNVDATSLAKQIVKARQAEIARMQQILAS
jgi:uncharacterized protein (DUF305 family)